MKVLFQISTSIFFTRHVSARQIFRETFLVNSLSLSLSLSLPRRCTRPKKPKSLTLRNIPIPGRLDARRQRSFPLERTFSQFSFSSRSRYHRSPPLRGSRCCWLRKKGGKKEDGKKELAIHGRNEFNATAGTTRISGSNVYRTERLPRARAYARVYRFRPLNWRRLCNSRLVSRDCGWTSLTNVIWYYNILILL